MLVNQVLPMSPIGPVFTAIAVLLYTMIWAKSKAKSLDLRQKETPCWIGWGFIYAFFWIVFLSEGALAR
jgi:hypothetical protein